MSCSSPAAPARRRSALLVAAVTLLAGCPTPGPTPDAGEGGETYDQPLYALMTQVYNADGGREVYVNLSHSLDVTSVDLGDARVFQQVANFAGIDGRLYVSDGESPVITAFDVSDDFTWTEHGQISFAAYPLSDNANFYYQYILRADAVYMPFDVTSRVVWNPQTLAFTGVFEESAVPATLDGLALELAGNRTSTRYDNDRVLQPFYYHDADWVSHGDASKIAAYDPTTHEETAVIDAPCPGLEVGTRDEDGNTYFSTMFYLPLLALYGDGPAPCVVRVGPDNTLDETFTTDLTDWTDGHYAIAFRYMSDGKAIANVLRHDELDADFTGDFDYAVVDQIWAGHHFDLWVFDLEAGTGTKVTGVEEPIGAYTQVSVIDGRTFVFIPVGNYEATATYEVSGAGVAEKRFEVAGDVFKWARVR